MKVQIQCDASKTGTGACLLPRRTTSSLLLESTNSNRDELVSDRERMFRCSVCGREMSALHLCVRGRSQIRPQAVGNYH